MHMGRGRVCVAFQGHSLRIKHRDTALDACRRRQKGGDRVLRVRHHVCAQLCMSRVCKCPRKADQKGVESCPAERSGHTWNGVQLYSTCTIWTMCHGTRGCMCVDTKKVLDPIRRVSGGFSFVLYRHALATGFDLVLNVHSYIVYMYTRKGKTVTHHILIAVGTTCTTRPPRTSTKALWWLTDATVFAGTYTHNLAVDGCRHAVVHLAVDL